MNDRATPDVPEIYQRMRLIHSWDYARCAELGIAVVGNGGLGAVTVQLLAMLGLGERGQTVLIDDDRIEPSNRSRIPYATPGDDGAQKVDVAARYLRQVRPERRVRVVPASVLSSEAQEAIAASDLLLGTVDSDLARVVMNHLAYAFCLPYFDAGAGVVVSAFGDEKLLHTGGQVRAVVPNVTPCLLCNLGVDRAAVDRELMRDFVAHDPRARETLERAGYIKGLAPESEQPSVAHLNFIVASAMVTLVLEYLLTGLPDAHATHVDLGQMEWMKSVSGRRAGCPVCDAGEIGHGRFFSPEALSVPISLAPDPAASPGE